jgi:thymidine phosphorylase
MSRVRVDLRERHVIATLNVVAGDWLDHDEAGLSEAAWRQLGASPGDVLAFSHPEPLLSLAHVRAKIFGRTLSPAELHAIVDDIVAGRYADVHLASFLTACAGGRLDRDETTALAQAMAASGDQLVWDQRLIVDKHCIGGLPGNRTTPIVVAIAAANGLIMPKTSSRAITSPAGTADTMEVLAPVTLDRAAMRRVVEAQGACIVWGGSVRLSPADDSLIRVERALDLDGEGQLIASVLSKKKAAGSTHVLIDLPLGPTAKVRTAERARWLAEEFVEVGRRLGLEVRTEITDGSQPVGHGIGPALEARDVLAVLRREGGAPEDLRARAVFLAGRLLEMAGACPEGSGGPTAARTLADGRAWSRFHAICEAQGGFREPPAAAHRHVVASPTAGRIAAVDNRKLAQAAKLAGAPLVTSAGLDLHVRAGDVVAGGQALFTLHAESPGELAYALGYVSSQEDLLRVEPEA